MTGKVKSREVAPPEPIAESGYFAINSGITIKAKNSRKRSLKKAMEPIIGPCASCKIMVESEYQPNPELIAKPCVIGILRIIAAIIPPKNEEIIKKKLKIKP